MTVVGRSTTVMEIAEVVTVWLTTMGRIIVKGVVTLVMVINDVEVMTSETVVPFWVATEVLSTVVGVVMVSVVGKKEVNIAVTVL